MTEESKPDIQSILDTAAIAFGAKTIGYDDQQIAFQRVLPHGYESEIVELDQYALNPRRARGIVRPATAEALVAYLNRFGDERTTIWVHPTSGIVEAVLDDHLPALRSQHQEDEALVSSISPEVPGHGDHRAVLELEHTPEWLVWTRSDDNWFTQVDFAEFIEANAKEIKTPTAAELLELAQTFHAQSDSTFRSAKRLHDGNTQLTYVENVNAQAGVNGELTVPSELELLISPFIGEPAYLVTARFRYRVAGGTLKLQYKLNRPNDIVRDALDKVAEKFDKEFDNVYIGEPRPLA